jgi:hypothetical protein
MSKPAKTVQPIHFEDFDGFQFERLVFAYHARTDKWHSLEWYGQTGSDLGRDIWGIRDDGTKDGESVCIQCVNRESLTFAKAKDDSDKVLKAINGAPKRFRIVARSNVSAQMRDRIKAHVAAKGVTHCDVWSGSEFEELLRHRAEALLKRFIEGEEFPDVAAELIAYAEAADTFSLAGQRKQPRRQSAVSAHWWTGCLEDGTENADYFMTVFNKSNDDLPWLNVHVFPSNSFQLEPREPRRERLMAGQYATYRFRMFEPDGRLTKWAERFANEPRNELSVRVFKSHSADGPLLIDSSLGEKLYDRSTTFSRK